MLAWYRDLIALRHRQADLADPDLAAVRVAHDAQARWLALRRGDVRVAVNLSKATAAIPSASVTHACWPPGSRSKRRARTGC